MAQISTYLDARRQNELAQDADWSPNDAAVAAMAALRAAQAAHPMLQALRPHFDQVAGVYPGLSGDLRAKIDDDEKLSEDDAQSEATDQILSYAESVADWLAKAYDTDEGRMPLDVRTLDAMQILEASPAVLLTVLMNGDSQQILRAVHRLRELAAAEFKREIDQRTAELLAEAAS